LEIERFFPKIASMPLRFEPRFFMGADIPEEIERHVLQLEFAFSGLSDTEALGALGAQKRKQVDHMLVRRVKSSLIPFLLYL
jgi:hypothetical protein